LTDRTEQGRVQDPHVPFDVDVLEVALHAVGLGHLAYAAVGTVLGRDDLVQVLPQWLERPEHRRPAAEHRRREEPQLQEGVAQRPGQRVVPVDRAVLRSDRQRPFGHAVGQGPRPLDGQAAGRCAVEVGERLGDRPMVDDQPVGRHEHLFAVSQGFEATAGPQ
jgi:hypothetical protein